MGKKSAKRVTNFLGTSAMTRPLFMLGAASVLLGTGPAHALDANTLPQNPNVVGGKDGFSQSGNTLNVNQSTKRTVIDWRSFDIGSKAQVNFNQPGTSSIAVNRVNASANASQIEGGLHANGQVWILNPNGVFFGKTAHVDAAGVVASTANIDTKAFMAGSNKLQMTGADHGAVENQGNITVGANGLAAFVAPSVRNSGTINATVGRVALAAGTTYTLDLAGDHLVELGLGSVKAVVDNSGKIVNPGGTIALTAKAAGQVVNSVVNVSGVVSASSVTKSGGTITLGGDNVTTTSTAQLSADAGTNGNGGSITSVANVQGNYAGSFSAKGGSASGNGGSVETSGKNVHVDDSIKINTLASNGYAGNWTVDPDDLTIVSGSDEGSIDPNASTVNSGTIVSEMATTGVTLAAKNSITVNSAIDLSGQTSQTTTLALNDQDGGGLTLNLNAAITLGAHEHLTGQATTVNLSNGALIQNGVDAALTNATLNLGAGTYASGATINKAGITIDGTPGAKINVTSGSGLTITANNVTVENLEIQGPISADYEDVDWSLPASTGTGIAVTGSPTSFNISNNDIHDIRTGIAVLGNSTSGSIIGNTVENTKGGIIIQYSDGTGYTISGNQEGTVGNEWGIVLNTNTPGINAGGAAPTSAQTNLLTLANANGGMSALDRHYSSSNRTKVTVDASSTATAADDGGFGNGLGSARQPLSTIQAGVDAVVAGGTVNVNDGTYIVDAAHGYAHGGSLWIDKSLSLIGQSEDGVIIDATNAATYGLRVTGPNSNVTLSNFTLYGDVHGQAGKTNGSGNSGYGIKVEQVTGFHISNVTSQGAFKSELDLNGVINGTIDNVTANGAPVGGGANTGGAGIQITDSQNITITNSKTLNNNWGGLSLQQSNSASGYPYQLTDITVDGSNTFNEANPVYAEDQSTMWDFGTLHLTGFDYVVKSPTDPNDVYTWFQRTQQDAINFAASVAPTTAAVEGYAGDSVNGTNIFTVGTSTGGTALSIQAAVNAAAAGATINVGDGTYNQNVVINKANLSLLSENGSASTIIDGQGGSADGQAATALGTIVVQANNFTLGNTGHGFTVLGLNNASAGIESAAVYFQGANSGSVIRGNDITARGDEGLLTEFGATVSNMVVDNNTFDGQTFVGPHGLGTADQFTVADIPRQLVVISGGTGGGNTSNITFTNNQITGTAGGLNTSGQEQGNTLVTIDSHGATITGNVFAGTTDRFGDALRARGTATTVSGNTFDGTNMGAGTNMLELNDSALTDDFANVIAANTFNNGSVWLDHSVAGVNYVFRGINSAITAANAGDVIHVGDGTYTGSVNVNKANLTLQSENGAASTIIDAGGAADAVTVSTAAGLGTITIDGFTVQDWTSRGIVQDYNGWSADTAAVNVTNNVVYGPAGGASAHGNGIEVSGDGSLVSGNQVFNDHLNSVDWSGSGIIVVNGSNITVDDNIVNGADTGIAVVNWNNPAGMSNISVTNNYVSNATDEGISVQSAEGEYFGTPSGPISGLTITGNTVTDSASGLGIWDYSNSHDGDWASTVSNISRNTFDRNTYQISTDFTGADLTSAYGNNTFDAAAFNATSKNAIYGDLQTAVSEASSGDTLDVKGTFTANSQIEVSQDLSIVGNATNKALLNVGTDFVGTNAASAWLLVDAGVNFDLSNVVMDGAGHQVTQGLRSQGNTTIDGVDFRNIASNGYLGFGVESFGGTVQGGIGSDTNGAGGSGSHLVITNSTFNNIGRDGILVKGDGSFAQITNNVYTGKGTGDHLDYGIEVGAGGFAEITGNTITNALGVASTDGSTSAGIEVTTYYGTPTVAIIKQNIVTGNTVAVDVGYDDPSTSADDDNDTSDVVAFGNNFSGNGVELESNNATADFRGNYWGTTDDSAILASMTGLRAASVDFSTYLTTGTDTSTATGFQGNFSNVTVTTLGGGTDRIAGAEQFALTGGTINVKAGTYAEDVTVGTQYAFNFNNVTVNSFTVDSAGAGSSVNGDLTATGAIALNGATTVDGDLTAASFTSNATLALTGDLTTSGATAFNGAATVDGDLTAASFTSNATLALTGDLTTSGAAALNGASNITGDVTTGSLTTGGSLALVGDLVAANGITLGGTSSIVGDVSGKTFTANGTLALNGDLSATGAAQFNGDTSVNGDVTAASITAAKTFALNGDATASGAITANGATKLDGKLTGGSIALNGATTLTGNTTLDTSAANGAIATAAIDGSTAGGQSLTVNAGSGNVSLGNLGATTRLGAVSDTSDTTLAGSTYNANSFVFGGDVTLTAANTTLNTTQSSGAAGDITFQGDLFGTTDGGQSLTLIAGPGTGAASANGDITLQNAGTTATNLNNMTVSGNDFTALTVDLAGNYTSQLTGNQVFAADTLNVKGNATSNVGGDASGHIVAGGDVTIAAGGDISGTISGENVTLTGDDVNTDVTAVNAATITGNTVEGSYNADTVTLVASNNVDAAVNATNFTLSAQNGSVDGTWTTIDASGSGVVNVNGQTTVGLADVNPNQLVVEGFVLPAGTTIGANGQLILPQGVLLGLLSPGGGKPKMILVHSVQQLGELLASGYSVIVIDLSNRDTGKPIELASN